MANPALLNALMGRPVRSVDDYLTQYDQRDAQKAQIQQNALAAMENSQLRKLQMDEVRGRQTAALLKAQQQQQKQNMRGGYLNSIDPSAGPAMEFNPIAASRAGFDPKEVEFFANAGNLGKPKVARTIEVAGPNGLPQTVLLDEQGRPVGNPFAKPVEMRVEDFGGTKQAINPYALQPGQTFTKTMTKTEQDASARGWAGINIQRQAEARQAEAARVAAAGGPAKPLPASALKMQQESLDAIGISSSINADLGGIAKQIETGKLSFGPIDNLVSAGLNMAGQSTENSRNFASFKSTLERLRNESLRLNAGVQTDGDAQRAWDELFQNINDTGLVKQRLAEIQNINKRGADLHRLRVDSIRSNYNAGPLDSGAYRDQPAAVGATPAPSGKPAKTVKRTGTSNGRKVVEYTDGSIEYAD